MSNEHATPHEDRLAAACELQRELMLREPMIHTVYRSIQDLSGWREQGRVFSVSFAGEETFPAFQFAADGQPLAQVRALLKVLRRDPRMTDWDIAVWFTTPTGALSGEVPKTLLNTRNEEAIARLTRAAEAEVAVDDGG